MHLRKSALKVNDLLSELFSRRGHELVDFKLEFGRLASDPSVIVLADEIRPDACHLWDLKAGGKMGKGRCRRDPCNVMEACEEVLGRAKETLG